MAAQPLRPPLRVRIVLLVLLPLVPLLGYVLYTGVTEQRKAARESKGAAHRLATAVAANQSQLIEEGRQLLTTLAKDPHVARGDWTACNVFLADTLGRWPRYANLGVIDRAGRIRCSAIPTPPGVNAADRLYFQQAVATRDFAVGEYQIGRITGKPSLNFGHPLLDANGDVTSVVFAALDLTWLNTLANEANLDPGTTITVVDRAGTILARYPDSERWVGQSARSEPVVRAVIEGEDGTAEAQGLDGVERFYGFTTLPGPSRAREVYVTAGIPTARALASVKQRLWRDLAVVALLAVIPAAVGWFGGGLLVERPVGRHERDLRARLQRVGRFGRRLASAGENGGVARTALTGMADAAGVDVGALYISREDGTLSLAATRGVDPANMPEHLRPGEGRAGRALAEIRPVAASDGDSPVRVQVLGAEAPIAHELNLPLLDDGRPVGVVALGRVANRTFTADELELLEHLAAQAGAAIGGAANRNRVDERNGVAPNGTDKAREGD